MSASPVADRIRTKLVAAFAPLELDIIDESSGHLGHAGYNPAGESHFRVRLASAQFDGKSRLERQRMVHAVLAEELGGRVHALVMVLQGSDA